jgi:hypothetical protein
MDKRRWLHFAVQVAEAGIAALAIEPLGFFPVAELLGSPG